jgi:hypothetical protein
MQAFSFKFERLLLALLAIRCYVVLKPWFWCVHEKARSSDSRAFLLFCGSPPYGRNPGSSKRSKTIIGTAIILLLCWFAFRSSRKLQT